MSAEYEEISSSNLADSCRELPADPVVIFPCHWPDTYNLNNLNLIEILKVVLSCGYTVSINVHEKNLH